MILPVVAEILARVGRHAAVESAVDALRRGGRETSLSGVSDPARALVCAHVSLALARPMILLVESNRRADALWGPLDFFFRALGARTPHPVCKLPALDVLPYQNRSPHAEIAELRGVSLWRWTTGQSLALLVPTGAALMRLEEPAFYAGLARSLARETEEPLEGLLSFVTAAGYEKRELAEMPGHYAVRGGIVDVFSPEAPRPVRIELLGDTIESLREFDPATQRSVAPVERTLLLPLTDVPRDRDLLERLRNSPVGGTVPAGDLPGWEFRISEIRPATSHLFALRPEALLAVDEPSDLHAAMQQFRERADDSWRNAASAGGWSPDPGLFFLSGEEYSAACDSRQRLALERLPIRKELRTGIGSGDEIVTQPTMPYHGNVAAFMAELRGRVQSGEAVLVSAANTGELERLADLCHEYELPYQLGERGEDATMTRLAGDSSAGSVPALTLVKAPLAEGVMFPEMELAIYGNADLFETLPAGLRPGPRARTAGFFSDLSDLRPGDYVVHVDHGIGQFEGLRQMAGAGVEDEFLALRYAEESRVYLPVARMDLVQKYSTLGGAAPSLDRLGGMAWAARKSRARKAVADIAERLLQLYAVRKTVDGHAFSRDIPWQREFEDAFEFEETPDQVTAIAEIKRDMEQAVPMDRLLCGDVGYGKTEVAMRAAFKAVCDGKQVAVLAPTTVLAFQHYETFRRRFGAFPARIEMLSRFRSPAERKQTVAELAAGAVDVAIGTHRLLSKDIAFRDLGLLIVDEEQRFGVVHKERLKELRRNVDVLTMSATPIPRTLHMSLVGLRDMSVIETPPRDRLSIQTVVAPFSESLVQSAIEEELAREGQVYFVHNRVESIASLASLLQRLAPAARIVVGHGQLDERELERVMLKVMRHEADILVSTTIIENGLDIPRVNTILINRADRFGLSELYQLRGRVGRSHLRAYAYLLVPPDVSLTPLARRRLAALREFSDLGAGFRVAALDLELRGAGNLLGGQQHGHINAIGFDMYCQMLERAVAGLKGEEAAPELRVTLNLGLDIRIPPAYIESEGLRLRTYKRIAGVSNGEQREEVQEEISDRFGPPPAAIRNLLDYAVLKALCERLLVATVERCGEQLGFKFYERTPVEPARLVRVVRRHRGARLDPGGMLWLPWTAGQGNPAEAARNVLLELEPQS